MALETEVSSETAPESETTAAASIAGSGSGYSVIDPGYEADTPEPVEDELEALKAENETEKKPDDETSDDASSDAEAGSDTEETTEESPDESADKDSFSDELLDRAAELGYTLEEIKGFRSEKSLEKDVLRSERLQQRMQERMASKTGKETPAQDEAEPEPEPEPNWEELLEAGHDPDVIAMQQKMWQRATKAEALVKQVFKADQDRAWDAQCERFDDTLNKLGEEYKSLLGNGRRGDLMKSSPEAAANRDRVFEKMAILRSGYAQAGKTMPPESELINEAVQASFYKQTQEIARKALKGEIKKAGSQALSRPRSAGTKALSGESLAMAKEREFWKDHS